jgi:hypothetical protein
MARLRWISRARPAPSRAEADPEVALMIDANSARWRAVIPARRTPRTGARRRTTLNLRSPELPCDREDFSYREDFSLAESEFLTSC